MLTYSMRVRGGVGSEAAHYIVDGDVSDVMNHDTRHDSISCSHLVPDTHHNSHSLSHVHTTCQEQDYRHCASEERKLYMKMLFML